MQNWSGRARERSVRRLARRGSAYAVVAALALSSVLVAACGGGGSSNSSSSNSTSSGSSGGTTTVTYGSIPFAGDAVIYLAQRKGYFKDVGLNVKIEKASAINTVVPSVAGGTYNFGLQSGGGVATAVSHNIPVSIIANCYFHDNEQQLMAKTGGPIKSLADLKGQKVALGALNNNYEAGLFYLLQKAGVDPKSVKFLTMDTSQIAGAVENGTVAAGQINEPFITSAGNKLTEVADPLKVFGKNAANAYVITNTKWADSHKDVVKKFLQAYNKAQALAASDRSAVASTIESYTDIDPKLIGKMNMPGFGPDLHGASQQQQMNFMYKDGFLDKQLKLNQVFYQGLDIQGLASAAASGS